MLYFYYYYYFLGPSWYTWSEGPTWTSGAVFTLCLRKKEKILRTRNMFFNIIWYFVGPPRGDRTNWYKRTTCECLLVNSFLYSAVKFMILTCQKVLINCLQCCSDFWIQVKSQVFINALELIHSCFYSNNLHRDLYEQHTTIKLILKRCSCWYGDIFCKKMII